MMSALVKGTVIGRHRSHALTKVASDHSGTLHSTLLLSERSKKAMRYIQHSKRAAMCRWIPSA